MRCHLDPAALSAPIPDIFYSGEDARDRADPRTRVRCSGWDPRVRSPDPNVPYPCRTRVHQTAEWHIVGPRGGLLAVVTRADGGEGAAWALVAQLRRRGTPLGRMTAYTDDVPARWVRDWPLRRRR